MVNKIFYADDLVEMSKNIENLREKFLKCKEAFESKRLKVNLKKIKVMVSGLKGEIFMNKISPCVMCSKRMMANSMPCNKMS